MFISRDLNGSKFYGTILPPLIFYFAFGFGEADQKWNLNRNVELSRII